MQTTMKLFFGALVLSAATPVLAGDDPRYPIYDFQPSVVYRDAELIAKSSTTPTATATGCPSSAAPMAYTGPRVEDHEPDPKYPAAYFKPTVIHP
jgi:hypothetical protein